MFKKILFFIFIIVIGLSVWFAYNIYFESNVNSAKKTYHIYIKPNTQLEELMDSLKKGKVLKNYDTFLLLAKQKKTMNIKSGHYIIKQGMTNRQAINMFVAGLQTPVKVYFNIARTKEDMARIISKQLMLSSDDLLSYLNSSDSVKKYGFTPETVKAMFLPNSYEFYWNVSVSKFCDRINFYYKKFWTEEKLKKAKRMKMSPLKVSVLASIVQAEQAQKLDEQPIIAGLYLNRLRKGIPLQADPTIMYALGDFGRRRILKSDLKIKSPYNTYINKGLPPAPINFPTQKTIDAVLNYQKNNYLFMCAKDDFSGYHYFSKTLRQHHIYARRYQKALNKSGIKK